MRQKSPDELFDDLMDQMQLVKGELKVLLNRLCTNEHFTKGFHCGLNDWTGRAWEYESDKDLLEFENDYVEGIEAGRKTRIWLKAKGFLEN